MVLGAPLVRLVDQDAVRAAQRGRLPGFDAARAAVTLGRFRSEQQQEFRAFAQLGTLLHGRYHLAYWLDERWRTNCPFSFFTLLNDQMSIF